MNYEEIIKNNYQRLESLFRTAYEKEFNNETVFFAGSGVFLGYPNKKNSIDDFVAFTFSKAKLKKLLSGTSLTVKDSMSKKVTLLVWNKGSWYHKGEFNNYNAKHITWESFLQVMANVIDDELQKGTLMREENK